MRDMARGASRALRCFLNVRSKCAPSVACHSTSDYCTNIIWFDFFVRSDLESPVIVAKIIKSVMHNGLYPSRCVKMSSHKYYIHKDKSIQVVSTSNKN